MCAVLSSPPSFPMRIVALAAPRSTSRHSSPAASSPCHSAGASQRSGISASAYRRATNPRPAAPGINSKECQKSTVNDHKVNPANDKLEIKVLDEPGAGGANHVYHVTGFGENGVMICFQNGPINENGINGVTQEALLAIVADRLRSFQAGKFACR